MLYEVKLGDEDILGIYESLEDAYEFMRIYATEHCIDDDEVHFEVTELDESLH